MKLADVLTPRASLWVLLLLVACVLSAEFGVVTTRPGAAQAAEDPSAKSTAARDDDRVAEGARDAEAALGAEQEDGAAAEEADQNTEAGAAGAEKMEISIRELLMKGGYLMLPIAAMSILTVTFFAERLLGLRRRKVLPAVLVSRLGTLGEKKGGLDPRRAYKLCQQYPSAAANVIKTMLLKVGRPQAELEHAVSEALNREAARLYANVRWLSLAAGVTPLMGLLGTVLGMIKAFLATASLPTGANKAEALAEGIYQALVTTAAGLSVAIPAAIAAHLFEGRIQNLLRELDETLLGLMPQFERFEGRLRVSKDQIEAPPAYSPPVVVEVRRPEVEAAGSEGRSAAGSEGRSAAGSEGRSAAGSEGRCAAGERPAPIPK